MHYHTFVDFLRTRKSLALCVAFTNLLLLLFATSCGTSRLSVRVKSNADGTLNSTITVSGSVTGGTTTPNVSVALPDSVKLVNYVPTTY